MERTPVRSVDAKAPTMFPSAKLAVVTRKAYDITKLLSDIDGNLPLITEYFTEYLTRVENLYEACSDEHEE